MWSVKIISSKEAAFALSTILEESADAFSSFEINEDKEWVTEAIYVEEPDHKELRRKLQAMANSCGFNCPKITIEKMPDKDWLSENRQAFPPITVAGFFIHGTHINPEIPKDHIALIINAATAFGTGSHETTSGCLEAITLVAEQAAIKKPLDLGCGTAILAMAMAKMFNCPVTAVDNDPEAIAVSQTNLERNKLQHLVHAFVNDGMNGLASYDLIVANILAGPLCTMAEDVIAKLDNKGYLILSGILNTQAADVKAAYSELKLLEELQRNDWTTLVFQNAKSN